MDRLVLLDADVVIKAFELGIWDKLVAKTQVSLARTVYDEVGHYFDPDTLAKKGIDLGPDSEAGRIQILDATIDTPVKLMERCRKHLELHGGELESIALVADAEGEGYFCTADGNAIQAMVLLDLTEQATSLEALLARIGLSRSFDERNQFSQAKFDFWLRRGGILKVQTAEL